MKPAIGYKVRRRALIESEISANPGKPISIRAMASLLGEASRVVKYDIQWLRDNKAMEIDEPSRDLIIFRQYRQVIHPLPPSHSGGVIICTLGMCEYCNKPLLQDKHTMFCSPICRETYNRLSAKEREERMFHKVELVIEAREQTAAEQRAVKETLDNIVIGPGDLDIVGDEPSDSEKDE